MSGRELNGANKSPLLDQGLAQPTLLSPPGCDPAATQFLWTFIANRRSVHFFLLRLATNNKQSELPALRSVRTDLDAAC